jgi:hypothetical protein
LPQQFEQFAAITGFARDFDAGDPCQDLSHFPAKPDMVVGQQNVIGAVHGFLLQAAALEPSVQAG